MADYDLEIMFYVIGLGLGSSSTHFKNSVVMTMKRDKDDRLVRALFQATMPVLKDLDPEGLCAVLEQEYLSNAKGRVAFENMMSKKIPANAPNKDILDAVGATTYGEVALIQNVCVLVISERYSSKDWLALKHLIQTPIFNGVG